MSTGVPEADGDLFVTAAEKAYQAILRKILTGEFAPGSRLVRRPLAKTLGMSAIPVLEAMKRLEQDGLIEYRAQWGSVVAVPTVERVKDMFVIREAVECQVARILSTEATAAQARTLRALAEELDRVRYESDDMNLINDLHYKLHVSMAEAAGYPSLIAALRRANFFWLLCRGTLSRRKRSPLQRNWHSLLIDNILCGDPEAADRAMRAHIRDASVPFIEDIASVS